LCNLDCNLAFNNLHLQSNSYQHNENFDEADGSGEWPHYDDHHDADYYYYENYDDYDYDGSGYEDVSSGIICFCVLFA